MARLDDGSKKVLNVRTEGANNGSFCNWQGNSLERGSSGVGSVWDEGKDRNPGAAFCFLSYDLEKAMVVRV